MTHSSMLTVYMAHQNLGCFGVQLKVGGFKIYIDTFINSWSRNFWGIYIGTNNYQIWLWPLAWKMVVRKRGEIRRLRLFRKKVNNDLVA